MIRFGCVVSVAIVIAVATRLSSQEKKGGGIVVDKDAKTVTIPVKVAPRVVLKEKKEPYPLEVIATWPHPKGKKAHETIITIDESIKPSDVHKALESLNQAGYAGRRGRQAEGTGVKIYFLVPDATGQERK